MAQKEREVVVEVTMTTDAAASALKTKKTYDLLLHYRNRTCYPQVTKVVVK